jgi:hypothetical protein
MWSLTIPRNPGVSLSSDSRICVALANVDYPAIISRAIFSHVIPIVLRHYYKPFQLKDTPAIREDDTPAVSLANWRLAYGSSSPGSDMGNGHASSKEKASKPKKETKLALKLLWHFRRLYLLQAVSGNGAY